MDLLCLPCFILGVFFMYWGLPILTLLGFLKPWRMKGWRNDPYQIGLGMATMFGVKVVKIPSNPVYADGPIMFLANHRSWADFFMEVVLTEGRGIMLSRMAVLYAFPMFMIPVRHIGACFVFKRGPIAKKDEFNASLDRYLAGSPHSGWVVYPEGHRSTKSRSLPLKRGMLHYAYGRRMPVQVVHSSNKEKIISEKAMTVHWGVTVAVAHSDVIHPKDFGDFEAFFNKVQHTWDATWALVDSTDVAGLKEFQPSPLRFDLPLPMRKAFRRYMVIMVSIFVGAVAVTIAATLWALLQLPPAVRVAVPAVLLAWLAVSLVYVRRPLNGRKKTQ